MLLATASLLMLPFAILQLLSTCWWCCCICGDGARGRAPAKLRPGMLLLLPPPHLMSVLLVPDSPEMSPTATC